MPKLKDVSWMDEGFYTCMAGNTIGETVSQVKLLWAKQVLIVKKNKPANLKGCALALEQSSTLQNAVQRVQHCKLQAYLHISSASRCLPVGLLLALALLPATLLQLVNNWCSCSCEHLQPCISCEKVWWRSEIRACVALRLIRLVISDCNGCQLFSRLRVTIDLRWQRWYRFW